MKILEGKAVDLLLDEKIAAIVLDDKENPMNTWTDDMYEGFLGAIYELKKRIRNKEVDGVIIISDKEKTFHTGANLNKTGKAEDSRVDKMRTIEFNQSVLNRLSKIGVPTLAAINGHCMGGGMELTLACDARIATDFAKTQIGLTETSVGLLPAGGGTQRLPRLIGYPAINLILDGKILTANQALEYGIVDKVVPAGCDLQEEAVKFIKDIINGKIKLKREKFDFSDELDKVLEEAKASELKKARGRLLPAPKAILQVFGEGLKLSLEDGLELEKQAFIVVNSSPECKGFINSFFLKGLTGDVRKLMTIKDFQPKEFNKFAVCGFGTMGRGIVVNALRDARIPVVVKDTPEALEAGKEFVRKTLEGLYAKNRIKVEPDELMKLLTFTESFDDNFKDVDIVVEAIYENLEAKYSLYKELCQVISDDCIIASNTSGIPLNTLAKGVDNPGRFCGMHFFSPVWIMELVEVVRGEKTKEETVNNALAFAGKLKKRPLVCNDNPGFVVNAVNVPFTRSGLQYIEEGNSIDKVNKAFQAFGFPVGPIKLIDEVGIDVIYFVYKNRGEEQKTLENMYNAGRYGLKKNGKGFFLQDGSVDPEALKLVAKRPSADRKEEDIPVDYLKAQIAIAKDLLDRKVVNDPAMVDIGIIYGTGYPKDKGGPLKWADLTGVSEEVYGKKFYE